MQRVTISLDDDLAQAFDALVAARGHANRSEAVRDLIRAELQLRDTRHAPQQPSVACLSYVYNHHVRELGERMVALQHQHHDLSVASLHVHLDHDHCLESVLLRGPAQALQTFADELCAQRGVRHGQLNLIAVSATDQGHTHAHGHPHPHVHDTPVR
jgi:CopG family transcriptional regulator, nickel-responsive regulator